VTEAETHAGSHAAGARVGRYEVIRLLGRGGMGEVYLARDMRLGRRVALKFLLRVDPRHRARFLVEAQATAQLTHENLVALYDVAEHQGSPYMVLEYVPGKTLAAWLDERRQSGGAGRSAGVPPARAAELMLPVARALACAHEAGIVHRDLKPENIMLAESGAVKVLDLGLVELIREAEAGAVSGPSPRSEAMIGTLEYMSPEQWGEDRVDERADLWAVGIVLYQMVTGEHPLAPVSMRSLASVTSLDEPMPSVRERMPGIGKLGAIIDRCLIKRKADRLGSAAALVAELAAVARPDAGAALDAPDEGNPYAGLATFQERDAPRFFGRERVVEAVVARLGEQPLLAIVGSSGAGKSSLVRAGVIPALKRGGDAWEAFVLRPGPRPLAALAELLLQPSWQLGLGARDPLGARLRLEPGLLGASMRARARRRREHILLFVDQLEELVTLAPEDERAPFLACLMGVADDPSSPLRLVVSVRQDFLDRVAGSQAELAALMSRGAVLVGPMGPSDLRRALLEPADLLGHQFESEALVTSMLAELEGAGGALPLLQFTASRLWEGRDPARRLLTEASYRAFGGVGGALASHADSVLGSLSPAERRWARVLLLHLVTPERTRALVTPRELAGVGGAMGTEVDRVLGRLVDGRLVTVEDAGRDESTVELIHESLITRWPALVRWLDDEQDDAQLRARLRGAAREWEASGGAEGLLWRGEPAEEARRWRERQGPEAEAELGAREARYLAAVIGLEQRERRRRRGGVGAVIAALCLVVLVVSILAVQARREAERARSARHDADKARQEADRKATDASDARLLAGFRELKNSGQLAWATGLLLRVQRPATARGWVALANDALRARSPSARSRPPTGFAHAVFIAPAGEVLVSAADDRKARLQRGGEADPVVFEGHKGWVTSAALSPDGKRVVTTSFDETARLWRGDGTFERELRGHTGPVRAAAFRPDGAQVVTASDDGTARLWRADDGGALAVLRGHTGGLTSAAWSPDGARLLTTSRDGSARLWGADGSLERALEGHGREVNAASWSPDGRRIVTASEDGTAQVWDADRGAPRVMLEHRSPVLCAIWSPDGERLATSSADGKVRVWSADGVGEPVGFEPPAPVLALRFLDRGQVLLGVAADGLASRWTLDVGALRAGLGAVPATCLPPDMRATYLGEPQEEAEQRYAACQAGAPDADPSPSALPDPDEDAEERVHAPLGPRAPGGSGAPPPAPGARRVDVFVLPGDALVEVDGKPARRRDGVIEVLLDPDEEKHLQATAGASGARVHDKSATLRAGASGPLLLDLNAELPSAGKNGPARPKAFRFED